MKLSIIIPTFNSEATLASCLESIVEQTFQDFEVLIMDGVSNDNTLLIAHTFSATYSCIKIFSESDKGIYDAMNKGIAQAKGEWVYFIGSDDTLFQKNTLELLFSNQQDVFEIADLVYGNVLFKEANIHSNYHENFELVDFLDTNINHQSMFYRKNIFEKIGAYSLDYPVFADWEFNVRLFFSAQFRIQYVRDIVAVFSLLGASNKKSDAWIEKRDGVIATLIKDKPLVLKLKYSNRMNRKKGGVHKIKFLLNKIFIKLLQ